MKNTIFLLSLAAVVGCKMPPKKVSVVAEVVTPMEVPEPPKPSTPYKVASLQEGNPCGLSCCDLALASVESKRTTCVEE